jgi:hypothetical protein
MIEKIIERIVIMSENRIKIVFYGEPPKRSPSVTWRKKSTEAYKNGGSEGTRTLGLLRDRQTL